MSAPVLASAVVWQVKCDVGVGVGMCSGVAGAVCCRRWRWHVQWCCRCGVMSALALGCAVVWQVQCVVGVGIGMCSGVAGAVRCQ